MSFDFEPRNVFHWGFVVPNMSRAVKGWISMGARLVVPPSEDPLQGVVCALLILNGSAPIELVAPIDPNENPVKNRLSKGGGLDHVCFFSEDVAADLANFEQKGAQVAVAPQYGAVFDRELAFVVTRVGLVVELMSRNAIGKLDNDPLSDFLSGAA